MMFSNIAVFILLTATTYLIAVYGLLKVAELLLKSHSTSSGEVRKV